MFSPKYAITNSILRHIGVIEASREVINNAPLVPAWEAKFREDAMVRTVYHGTHIEGNELNFSEAQKILQVPHVTKPQHAAEIAGIVGRDRDIQEIINYRNVLRFMEEYQHVQTKSGLRSPETSSSDDGLQQEDLLQGISEQVIKHLHKLTVEKILAADRCGVYRDTQVVIKNSVTGEITFRPPPAVEIPYQMSDFLHWLAETKPEDMHPIIKAGIVQYELVRIHPFLDGNGRVARALAMLVLFLEGYDIRKFFSMEEYYDRDATRYYDALQSVEKHEFDMTGWLDYFTEGLAIELSRVKDKVKSLSTDLHLKEKLGGEQVFLTERQIKIVEFIQKAGYLQNQAFRQLFPLISEDTILRDLKTLIDRKIIKKEGVTKASKYVLTT